MKSFITVVQISATKFDVEKVNAQTSSMVRAKGLLVSCWESNKQNDKYCFELAEKMNKEHQAKSPPSMSKMFLGI